MNEERRTKIIFKTQDMKQDLRRKPNQRTRRPVCSMKLIKPCFRKAKRRFERTNRAALSFSSKNNGMQSPSSIKGKLYKNTPTIGLPRTGAVQHGTQSPIRQSSPNIQRSIEMKQIIDDTFYVKRIKYFEKMNKATPGIKGILALNSQMAESKVQRLTWEILMILKSPIYANINKIDKGDGNNSFKVNYIEHLEDPMDFNLRSITLKIPTLKNYVRRRSSKDTYTSSKNLGSQKDIQVGKFDQSKISQNLSMSSERINSCKNIPDQRAQYCHHDNSKIFLSDNNEMFGSGELDLGDDVREALNLKVMLYSGQDFTKTKEFQSKSKPVKSIKKHDLLKRRPQTTGNSTSGRICVQSSKIKKTFAKSQRRKRGSKAAHLVLNIPNRIVKHQQSVKKEMLNSSTIDGDMIKEKPPSPENDNQTRKKRLNEVKRLLKRLKSNPKPKIRRNQDLMIMKKPTIGRRRDKVFKGQKNSLLCKNKLTMGATELQNVQNKTMLLFSKPNLRSRMRNANELDLTGFKKRNSSAISQILVNDHIRGGTGDCKRRELTSSTKKARLIDEDIMSQESEEKLNQAFEKALEEANLRSPSRVTVYSDPKIIKQQEDQMKFTRKIQSKFIIKKGIKKRVLGFRENSIRLSQKGFHVFIPPPLQNISTPEVLSSVNEECTSKGCIDNQKDSLKDLNICVEDQSNHSQVEANVYLTQRYKNFNREPSYFSSQPVTRNPSKEKISGIPAGNLSMQEKEKMLNIASSHLDMSKEILYANNTNFVLGNPLEKDSLKGEQTKLAAKESEMCSFSDTSDEKPILRSVGTNVRLNVPFSFNPGDYKLPSQKE
ncbi:unnamed protein product [Moneuplotes crassus]|uniref:Uncharacterized protein n=1 Tax=Euplotes crassus TaxID=5936 RepID=A0AAD2D7B7_EUPCR|nr:unnamed protein product [Moneuplotes crassus]